MTNKAAESTQSPADYFDKQITMLAPGQSKKSVSTRQKEALALQEEFTATPTIELGNRKDEFHDRLQLLLAGLLNHKSSSEGQRYPFARVEEEAGNTRSSLDKIS